jgi:hypothetical protein
MLFPSAQDTSHIIDGIAEVMRRGDRVDCKHMKFKPKPYEQPYAVYVYPNPGSPRTMSTCSTNPGQNEG